MGSTDRDMRAALKSVPSFEPPLSWRPHRSSPRVHVGIRFGQETVGYPTKALKQART
jgi:hypothetical protein